MPKRSPRTRARGGDLPPRRTEARAAAAQTRTRREPEPEPKPEPDDDPDRVDPMLECWRVIAGSLQRLAASAEAYVANAPAKKKPSKKGRGK